MPVMGAVPHAWLIVPLVKASRVIVASYASIMWHQLQPHQASVLASLLCVGHGTPRYLRVGVALGQGLERSFARVARGVRRQRVEVDKGAICTTMLVSEAGKSARTSS